MVIACAAEVVIANVIPPPGIQPPPNLYRKAPEQAYSRPPPDRIPVAPPRGADVASVTHASQQPLPRSDSDNTWASEASLAAANVASRANGQVPFVQQQQNKQHPAVSHAQKPGGRAPVPAQQRMVTGQGRGQAATLREGTSPRPEQAAAPAPEAASAGWTCPTCTYRHEGKQAGFLACAMCGGVRKET